jgi:hypothetical protein
MNKGAIVKIAGFLVVPIILMLVVVYLLYPMLNKDRYDLIVRTNGTMYDSVMVDSLARVDSLMRADSIAVADSLALVEAELLERANRMNFATKIDSLERLVYVLSARLEGLAEREVPQQQANPQQQVASAEELEEETFQDRVKSLLNLEEDEMAPILDKMTGEQLVRLYREAGNTQREKILRALNSDRAARLITEVML